jgi:hypothetical protein
MITIHYDYTDGTEISYLEGQTKMNNFTTCCLDFFDFNYITESCDDIIVLCKNGDSISARELLSSGHNYCAKEIRICHNIHKMLLAGAFTFKKDIPVKCISVKGVGK